MNILGISPHTDDVELGCGASIHKLSKDNNIRIISLSGRFDGKNLYSEFEKSMGILGVQSFYCYDFNPRNFSQDRQRILDTFILENKDFLPDLVFVPMRGDKHQDHKTTTEESLRAFNCSIIGYELPWNTFNPTFNYFIKLEEENVNKKIEAFLCYTSQRDRFYYDTELLKSICISRGVYMKTKYAEAFELIKYIQK